MNIKPGKTALVTTNEWFTAPDGNSYKAVFGTVRGCHTAEKTLGIKPNGRSTNWYLEIGKMIIAGCQIHYAIQTDCCSKGRSKDWSASASDGIKEYQSPSRIYFADGEE